MRSRISRNRGSIESTAFAANPLLAAGNLANAQTNGGRALIPLLPRWAVLFRGVRTFGRVVYVCVNRGATLGHVGPYPEIWSTPCGQGGWDDDRGLSSSSQGGRVDLSLSNNEKQAGSMLSNSRIFTAR